MIASNLFKTVQYHCGFFCNSGTVCKCPDIIIYLNTRKLVLASW